MNNHNSLTTLARRRILAVGAAAHGLAPLAFLRADSGAADDEPATPPRPGVRLV